MRKTNKNLTKQILTLMLAFVMVFTGMGIGSWGVSEAWADTTQITFTQVGIAEGGYDDVIDCSIKMGKSTIKKLYIKNVNINDGFILKNGCGRTILTKANVINIDGTSDKGKFSKDEEVGMNDSRITSAKFIDKQKIMTTFGEEFYKQNCTSGSSAYYFWGFASSSPSIQIFPESYGLFVQITGKSDVDRTTIDNLIESVWKDGKYTDDYYKENDRYNGKTTMAIDRKNRTNGFWYALTRADGPLEIAKKDFASEEERDIAAKNLQAAIANLIPKTQINATALYEAIQEQGNYPEDWLEDLTAPSLKTYKETLKAATDYLALLFEDGKATAENDVKKDKGKADKLANALMKFDFVWQESVSEAKENLKMIQALAKRYDMTENNGKYTDDSWNTFASARKAAVEYAEKHPVSESMSSAETKEYSKLTREFLSAAYALTSAKDTITVTFDYTDDFHMRNTKINDPDKNMSDPDGNKVQKQICEISSGTTLNELYQKMGYTQKDNYFTSENYSTWRTFVNGTMLYGSTPGQVKTLPDSDYVLKDGDDVQFVHMDWPTRVFNVIYREDVSWDKMADHLGILRLSEGNGNKQSANAGENINLTVERTSAHPWTYTGKYGAYEGATLAAYGPQQTDGSYPKTPILSEKASNADGSVSMKLYEAGKYIITAYDARENDEDKSLFYSGNVAAPYIEIEVKNATDTGAVKAELKAALDKVYKEYPQEYFRPENWTNIQNAYNEAIAVLNRADSTVAEAYNARQAAIKAIRGIQEETTAENTNNLATFRKHLNRLPDDVSLITKSVESTVTALINTYEGTGSTKGMSDYQKTQLTGVEQAKYDSIKALLEKGELPAEKSYSLSLNIKADTSEATEQIKKVMQYLHDNPARMDSVSGEPGTGTYTATPYSFNVTDSKANPLSGIRFYGDLTYNAYFHNDKSQRYHASDPKNTLTIDIPGTDCTITDESIYFIKNGKSLAYDVNGSLTLNVDGTTYELKSVTYEGLEESDVAYGTLSCLDFSGYKGKNDQWVNMYFTKAYLGFTMPYNDVTITLNWGPVTSAAEIQAAKDSAKSVLDETFAGYEKEKASYSEANWTILENAYNTGKSSIEAATTLDDVASARKTAITTMAKVKKEGTTVSKPNAVGTVYVTVENTTFPKSKWEGKTYWEGQLVDNMPIEITNDSTMMSCVVEALEKVGATQKGAEANYISEITDKEGHSLAEFDGSPSSGWMGTLNDWFNNEGFGNFTVANGALGDGDEIHIMYTTKGYGEDLGGSWANSNTTLKDLSVSGGTLTPSFTSGTSGNSYDYTLLISGKTANIKVTPTAANKNFLTKIFLNEKVTSNVQGSSFYKRTQYIPVTAGDTIYVGCGERRWPSMNNQEGNTQANGGTWYALKVVNSTNAKDTIEKAIAELPDADKIKIGNYKNTKDAAKDIRDLYNSLTSTVQGTIDKAKLDKLKAVEEKVKFYSEIDDAKAKLNALTDSSSSSQAKAALSAYEKLTKEQKEYITEADAAKFNELAKKYKLSTITGSAEMPESPVETTGKAGSAVTTSPTEVKVSGTTATVTVKAANQKEILKQAKEKKSAQVVLAIANSDAKGAEKLELNLDKSFLESLLKDTSAKLVVKTPLGQKTYERDELQKLVNETTGTTVKAEINKDNVDTAAEEPTEENAAKIEKAKSIVKNMKLVARSSKTAKKNIKAVLKSDAKVKASIKELKDLGFTVKYRFYRSTKKAASYKSTVTKKTATYTNTSGKKGTKYFYKVQVRVYDENGKLIAKTALKQCKYASRTWTKVK